MTKKGLIYVVFLLFLLGMNVYYAQAGDNATMNCPDFNNNTVVDFDDYLKFVKSFGSVEGSPKYNASSDFNKDKVIDFADFLVIAKLFGKSCYDTGPSASLESEKSYIYTGSQRIASINRYNEVGFYHSDHLGSASRITDEAGNIVFSADYMPFGSELSFSGNAATKFKYTGKELDDESGWYYYGARYYDPAIGRFTSVDPLPKGVNRYVYVYNNPLKLVDPSGREATPGALVLHKITSSELSRSSTEGDYARVKKFMAHFTQENKGGTPQAWAIQYIISTKDGTGSWHVLQNGRDQGVNANGEGGAYSSIDEVQSKYKDKFTLNDKEILEFVQTGKYAKTLGRIAMDPTGEGITEIVERKSYQYFEKEMAGKVTELFKRGATAQQIEAVMKSDSSTSSVRIGTPRAAEKGSGLPGTKSTVISEERKKQLAEENKKAQEELWGN